MCPPLTVSQRPREFLKPPPPTGGGNQPAGEPENRCWRAGKQVLADWTPFPLGKGLAEDIPCSIHSYRCTYARAFLPLTVHSFVPDSPVGCPQGPRNCGASLLSPPNTRRTTRTPPGLQSAVTPCPIHTQQAHAGMTTHTRGFWVAQLPSPTYR